MRVQGRTALFCLIVVLTSVLVGQVNRGPEYQVGRYLRLRGSQVARVGKAEGGTGVGGWLSELGCRPGKPRHCQQPQTLSFTATATTSPCDDNHTLAYLYNRRHQWTTPRKRYQQPGNPIAPRRPQTHTRTLTGSFRNLVAIFVPGPPYHGQYHYHPLTTKVPL